MSRSIVVLYVGDDTDFAGTIEGSLTERDERIEFETVTGHEDALDRISTGTVDLVAVDRESTDPDDPLFLERVRALDKALPAVAIVGPGPEYSGTAEIVLSSGATDIVRKPTDATGFTVLANRLTNYVDAAETGTEPNKREFETVVEAMGDGVYTADEDGRIVRANTIAAELAGYERDELVGARATEFLNEDVLDDFESAIERLRDDDRSSTETVQTALNPADGDPVPVEVTLTQLRDEGDDITGTVGVVRDVTERRARKRELERFETLLELMPDTVVITDMEGFITDIYGYDDYSGWEYEELMGSHSSRTMSEEDVEQVQSIVTDLVRSDERNKATFEYDLLTKSDGAIPMEDHITLLPPDEDGIVPGTMSVLRDITDRKERERELEAQNERLERFAAIVSHDLRNPLNVAAGHLELARAESDDEHLETVAGSLDRMEQLIEDLLALAKAGDGSEPWSELDLQAIAREAWETVETGDATLTVTVEGSVEGLEGRLKQLLENLLRNAVEHAGDDATVAIGDLEDRPGFFVADDGPGIPESNRETVFESGYTTAEDGTGFGLSIVREVADTHGWDVVATDADLGGARFEIRFG